MKYVRYTTFYLSLFALLFPFSPAQAVVGSGSYDITVPMHGSIYIPEITHDGVNVLAYIDSYVDYFAAQSTTNKLTHHTLKIVDMNLAENYIDVEMDILLEPFRMKLGKLATVDFESDGVADMTIKFADLKVNRVELTFASIHGLEHDMTESEEMPQAEPQVYEFSRNLTIGSVGDDVRELQQYLNDHGFTVAVTGPGSAGNESAYFGPLTQSALAQFQVAHDIEPSTGFFGPITRSRINE